MNPKAWNSRADAVLKSMYQENYALDDIVDMIREESGLEKTKNAVIGRAHRFGMTRDKKTPVINRDQRDLEICKFIDDGWSVRDLAVKFNVSSAHVTGLANALKNIPEEKGQGAA